MGAATTITANTFGGTVTYVPGGNYYNLFSGTPSFPTTYDQVPNAGPIGRYGAGTFAPVPEAAGFALAGVGLLGLVYVGRCYRQKLQLA